MKALVKAERAKGLKLQTVDRPTIKDPRDVLIQIKHTAICGTDLHIYDWDKWAQNTIPTPMHIGHEFSGVIVDMGPLASSRLKIGQRVSAEGHIACHQCRNCHAGREHICPYTKGIGVNIPGAFAEYIVMPSQNIVPLDDTFCGSIGAIMDPFGNALHTALAFNTIAEDVLITGAGPIGIMAAMICQMTGARNVVISDPNPYRRKLASNCGIQHVFDPAHDHLNDLMASLRMEEGFDVGLEISGHKDALQTLIHYSVNGGKIALLGLFPDVIDIDLNDLIFKGIRVKGIYGREMMETWYKMKALIDSGLNLSQIITHEFSYEDFEQAFELGLTGQSGKIILHW